MWFSASRLPTFVRDSCGAIGCFNALCCPKILRVSYSATPRKRSISTRAASFDIPKREPISTTRFGPGFSLSMASAGSDCTLWSSNLDIWNLLIFRKLRGDLGRQLVVAVTNLFVKVDELLTGILEEQLALDINRHSKNVHEQHRHVHRDALPVVPKNQVSPGR